MYLVYLTILQKSIRKETSLASGFLWKTANRKIARAYGTVTVLWSRLPSAVHV